eukprot:c2065_g1_i1 orf=1-180(-)
MHVHATSSMYVTSTHAAGMYVRCECGHQVCKEEAAGQSFGLKKMFVQYYLLIVTIFETFF